MPKCLICQRPKFSLRDNKRQREKARRTGVNPTPALRRKYVSFLSVAPAPRTVLGTGGAGEFSLDPYHAGDGGGHKAGQKRCQLRCYVLPSGRYCETHAAGPQEQLSGGRRQRERPRHPTGKATQASLGGRGLASPPLPTSGLASRAAPEGPPHTEPQEYTAQVSMQ